MSKFEFEVGSDMAILNPFVTPFTVSEYGPAAGACSPSRALALLDAARDAAGERTIDVTAVDEAIDATAWSANWSDERRAYVYEWDLPLVSGPAIGLHGLYTIQDRIVEDGSRRRVWAHVRQPKADAKPGVSGAVVTVWLQSDDELPMMMNGIGTLWADGDDYGAGVGVGSSRPSAYDREHFDGFLAMFSLVLSTVMISNSLAQAIPASVVSRKSTVPPKARAAARKGKGRVVPRVTSSITLPGLHFEPSSGRWSGRSVSGVRWHLVRGHWRTLRAERYGDNRGKRVWVRPFSKGDVRLGVTTADITVAS